MVCWLLLAFIISSSPSLARTFDLTAATVSATDGDTLKTGSKHIWLSAIDAPELTLVCRSDAARAQLCGREAQSALSKLTRKGVRCTVETIDRYGRDVAACVTASGLDLGHQLIRQGWAIP